MKKLRPAVLIAIGIAMSSVATSAIPIIPSLNILVWGTIELQRETWSPFRTMHAPQALRVNDQVRPAQGQRGTILCSDLSRRDIATGGAQLLSRLCPEIGVQIIPGEGGDYLPPRGGSDPLIPYIISPRLTKILTTTPLIRWNAVPNATQYVVTVLDSSGVIWQSEVSGTEVRYPGDPALQQGMSYAVVVESDTGVSSVAEGIPGLAFGLLNSTVAQEAEDSIEALVSQDLPDMATMNALVYLYQKYDLLAEAIEKLENSEHREEWTAANYQLLGDLYRQTRLNLLAKDAYLKAVELAQTEADLETQAESQVVLGGVYLMLQDREAAVESLRSAREIYMELEGENSEQARDIEQQISALTQ